MRAQLAAQQAGLCGNDWLGGGFQTQRSNWIGGPGGNGLAESYPYWLNGAYAMSVLLGNETRQAQIAAQMNYIFDRQNSTHADGWLGPLVDGNPWSTFRFLMGLVQYIDATGDARAVASMWTYAGRLLARLVNNPLPKGDWSHSRWQELLEAYQWLLSSAHGAAATDEQRSAAWALMRVARAQGFPWAAWIESDADHPFVPNTTLPAGANCTQKCALTGHRCAGNVSSYNQMSCAMGCTIAARTPDEPACAAVCAQAQRNNSCDFRWDGFDFQVCQVCPDKCRALADECALGCGYAHGRDPQEIPGWFPTNTQDADSIGNNIWLPTPKALNRQWTHGVNLGQALMTWGLLYRLDNNASWVSRGRAGWDKVMKLHGQATGVPTGDETLAGTPPDRGTETCGVVETMNSAAEMYKITGDVRYADQLERIALNALPGAFFNGTPVKILQSTFLDWTPCFSQLCAWIFITAYCFAIP